MEKVTRKDGKEYTLKDNKHRFFFPKEYMKFEDLLKDKQKHTAKFLINTGARINEVRHIKVEDIDTFNKRIVLRVTKTKAAKKEKRGRMRTIPISKQFARYLSTYINKNKLTAEDDFGILSTNAMNQGIKKAAKLSGIKDYYNISCHNLRKTLEVWLMALGVDGLKLTAHFGHDMKTAAMYYVSPDIFSFEEKQQMRIIIGGLYG